MNGRVQHLQLCGGLPAVLCPHLSCALLGGEQPDMLHAHRAQVAGAAPEVRRTVVIGKNLNGDQGRLVHGPGGDRVHGDDGYIG